MLFQKNSYLTTYVKVVRKVLDQHFNKLLFSNPGEKFLILVESRGQICPVFFLLFRTFSHGLENNDTEKVWSDNFPTTLTYMCLSWKIVRAIFQCMVFLQSWGKDSNSYKHFMKPGSQSATYIFLILFVLVHYLQTSKDSVSPACGVLFRKAYLREVIMNQKLFTCRPACI